MLMIGDLLVCYSVAANTDPITSTPVTAGTVGTLIHTATATDADSDALTFTGTTLPKGYGNRQWQQFCCAFWYTNYGWYLCCFTDSR